MLFLFIMCYYGLSVIIFYCVLVNYRRIRLYDNIGT